MKGLDYAPSTSTNVFTQLTVHEQRQHRQAIEKLHKALFQRYTPADYKILGDSIRALHPTLFIHFTDGREVRNAMLGGIRFLTVSGRQEQTYEVSIEHAGADQFNVTVVIHDSNGKLAYVRVAATKRFQGIDAYILELLEVLRKE